MKKNNDLTTSFSFHWSPVQKLYGGFFCKPFERSFKLKKNIIFAQKYNDMMTKEQHIQHRADTFFKM